MTEQMLLLLLFGFCSCIPIEDFGLDHLETQRKKIQVVNQIQDLGQALGQGVLSQDEMQDPIMDLMDKKQKPTSDAVQNAYKLNIDQLNQVINEINKVIETDKNMMNANAIGIDANIPKEDRFMSRHLMGVDDDDDNNVDADMFNDQIPNMPDCVGEECFDNLLHKLMKAHDDKERRKREVKCIGRQCGGNNKCFGPQCQGKRLKRETFDFAKLESQFNTKKDDKLCFGPGCQRDTDVKADRVQLGQDQFRFMPKVRSQNKKESVSDIQVLEREAENLLKAIEERYNAEIEKLQVIDKKLKELNVDSEMKKSVPKLPKEIEEKTTKKSIKKDVVLDDNENIIEKLLRMNKEKSNSTTEKAIQLTTESSTSKSIGKAAVDEKTDSDLKKIDKKTSDLLDFPRDAQGMSNKALVKGIQDVLPKLSKSMMTGQPSSTDIGISTTTEDSSTITTSKM